MASPDAREKVWDPLVRIGHWTLVACVLVAWLTRTGNPNWHERFGYAALAVVVVRFFWGFAGSRYARFSHFMRSPRATLAYAKLVGAGREPRYLGHNPLGGWMTAALLLAVALVGLSGWLYTTDAFWGVPWVAATHELLADTLFVLVAAHVSGVAFTSWRHRDNLVAAMLHGRKRSG